MRGDGIRRRAAARAEELPGAALTHPFGPGWDVWKVRDKVFLLQSVLDGEQLTTLKCAPEDALALCEALAEITPGYHMNKRHWISVRAGAGIDAALVDDLVTDSYLLVVSRLARAQQPVDPRSFGRR